MSETAVESLLGKPDVVVGSPPSYSWEYQDADVKEFDRNYVTITFKNSVVMSYTGVIDGKYVMLATNGERRP